MIIMTMNTVHKPSNIFTDGESTCQGEYSTQQMGQWESFGKTGSFGTNGGCPFGSGHQDYNPFSQMAVVPTHSTQIQVESGKTQVPSTTTTCPKTSNNLFHQVKIKL